MKLKNNGVVTNDEYSTLTIRERKVIARWEKAERKKKYHPRRYKRQLDDKKRIV